VILALAGGVGGAKLANGLAQILSPDELIVVVNTGDDFSHLGLRISPDLDTVMYTLAGRNNDESGWGLAGETWHVMTALERVGAETWFRLGDQDLATHIERTRRLAEGETLSEVTAALCRAFNIRHCVVPMTDQPVQTIIHTDEGTLAFQHYFVRRRCEPRVLSVEFIGHRQAVPAQKFAAALGDNRLRAIIICPSNPYLSIQPILAVPGVRQAVGSRRIPVVAVSPIVDGAAVKGPAAKIMRELGYAPSAAEIARLYQGFAHGIMIDELDRNLSATIEAMGLRARVTATVMRGAADQARLAQEVVAFAGSIAVRSGPVNQ
jgi:LPPG:FO 2-phospho-L-lactate transferase